MYYYCQTQKFASKAVRFANILKDDLQNDIDISTVQVGYAYWRSCGSSMCMAYYANASTWASSLEMSKHNGGDAKSITYKQRQCYVRKHFKTSIWKHRVANFIDVFVYVYVYLCVWMCVCVYVFVCVRACEPFSVLLTYPHSHKLSPSLPIFQIDDYDVVISETAESQVDTYHVLFTLPDLSQ